MEISRNPKANSQSNDENLNYDQGLNHMLENKQEQLKSEGDSSIRILEQYGRRYHQDFDFD